MQNVTKMSLSASALLLSLIAPASAGTTDREQDYDRDPGTSVRAPYADVDTRRGETWVDAPYARVYSGRDGTRVRAPFVDLFVPRDDRR
jgi:hypothetical protein